MMNGAVTPVTVREFDDDAAQRWDAFVETCPDATFFHRSGWRQVIQSCLGHRCCFLLAEQGDEIRGVLPLVHVNRRIFGKALISGGFLVLGGPVTVDRVARDALDSAAIEIATRLGVDHLEYRLQAPMHDDWPCNSTLYAYFRKAILPDPEANLRGIPRKQRAVVRKGIANGLQADVDSDVDRFYPAFSESYRNLGTPVLPKRYFAKIIEVFGNKCEIVTITHKGKILSSVIVFLHRDQVMPYFGGGVREARDLAANDFMYWETMKRGCERGYRVFDFGRSKRATGSFEFKQHWGFMPEPLHYEYKLLTGTEIPSINPKNPKFSLMISIWQKLPVWTANLIGPIIARQLA
jgi:FemAB-related protein (PEP-CTERM system-associated)